MEFDEDNAIKYINDKLQAEGHSPYPGDELLNIIDMIYDYYEENGLLDIDNADDDSADGTDLQEELVDYVGRMLRKDKGACVNPDDVPLIVASEIEYEDSLD